MTKLERQFTLFMYRRMKQENKTITEDIKKSCAFYLDMINKLDQKHLNDVGMTIEEFYNKQHEKITQAYCKLIQEPDTTLNELYLSFVSLCGLENAMQEKNQEPLIFD